MLNRTDCERGARILHQQLGAVTCIRRPDNWSWIDARSVAVGLARVLDGAPRDGDPWREPLDRIRASLDAAITAEDWSSVVGCSKLLGAMLEGADRLVAAQEWQPSRPVAQA